MHDPHATSPAGREPDASLAAALADVHVAIARSADAADLMAALVVVLARRAPARAELCLIECDEHGAAQTITTAATWDGESTTAVPSAPTAVTDAPLASLWLARPDTVLQVSDLDADPRISAEARRLLLPHRAVTVVPLHSPRHRSWQGCIRLYWTTPHLADAEERFVDRLLMQTLAATIASRRSLLAHEAALAETRALSLAQARLHAASDFAGLLAVVAELAAADTDATDVADVAWLSRVDPDDTGAPAWFEVLATRGDAAVQAGARFHVPALARRPANGEPNQFIADIEDATDLDPGVRQLAHTFGVRAAATLPLRWRGRFTGMIVLGWTDLHRFTPGERRLHVALARQAAVVFDSRMLLAQTDAALRQHRKQQATLEALLDNLPVAVVVHAVARDEPTLINRQGQRLARDLVDRELLYPGTDTPMPANQWPIARALHTGKVVASEGELRTSDGTRRTFESVAAPVRDEHGAMTHVIAVSTEVTRRRQAEAERLAMQQALIRAQDEALAERSAPLLPIADDILVMPIVGTVDDSRGRQITETLVTLGGHRRVRVAILDLTGAGTLDARGAHALVGAAHALRLRGAIPILTGFSPDTAAALTAQGIDLSGLIVRRSLRSGIIHARTLLRR